MTDDSNNPSSDIFSSASFSVIYVYSVPNVPAFEGRVKIGDTTLPASIQSVEDVTQEVMEKAARKRIDSYTKTTDLEYVLEHVELAIRPVNLHDETEGIEGFRDYKIHALLKRNGHKKSFARKDKKSGEWFEISAATAKEAIAKYKAHEEFLGIVKANIVLRPEQEDAVAQTLKVFKNGSIDNSKKMLWNAKMRFGKTLTSYELIKKLEEKQGIKKVLIITHRPDVNESWTADYRISGLKELGWRFGSKKNDVSWAEVSKNDKFIWFASIQDLRGSYSANNLSDADFQNLKKNQELFATEFDLLITDEAHEGNMTELARRMTKELKASYMLDLSGTPFNLLQAEAWDDELAIRFNYDGNIYNWSYPDERRAKRKWAEEHPEEPNPYAELPEMKWITYDISEGIKEISGNANAGVSFNELFRVVVDSKGKPVTPATFVHEEQVRDLLSKIRGDKKYSNDPRLFPYNRSFENQFNHTLWMLPSVPACAAMKELLGDSETGFDAYEVVNATLNGSSGWSEDNALETVKKSIKGHKKTITLSYRMLTTGITVKEWTAVFMLNNVSNPMTYMQTAFRAASPGSLADGRIKETAYVFDFNPDRCLRQIVETAKWNAATPDEAKGTEQEGLTQTELDEVAVKDYLNYISILSLRGSTFIEPDSAAIMDRLNEVYVNEVVAKGFDSPLLWNNKELMHFDIKRAVILENLRKMQGGSLDKRAGKVEISSYDEETQAKHEELKKQAREARNNPDAPQPTKENEDELKKLDKDKAQLAKTRKNAIGILVGIAARMPMLVFASPTDQKITPSNFAELIDEQSWSEFMPKNLKRIMPEGTPSLEERQDLALEGEGNVLYWDDVKRFFNDEIFWRASERIRTIALEIESKGVIERKFRKDMLFTTFRNPDKETVLTPARVVELQYTKTLGGLNFYDLEQSTAKEWYVFVKSLETGEQEVHEAHQVLRMLDEGTHELDPRWIPSEVDKVENDRDGFWEDRGLSIYDINSKTALYLLFAATSAWYANREAFYELNSDSNLTREELDNELWKNTVEKAIFLNVRVPYSASIAQRVLAGFNKKLAKSSRENTTVVDVITLKNLVKAWNSIKKSDRKDYWKPIEDEYDFIGKILRLANVGFMESHSREVWTKLKQNENYVFLLNNLGKINEGTMTMDELKKLKDLAESVKFGLQKFDSVVGNSPYQVETAQKETAGQKTVKNVFHDFQMISTSLASKTSLIYPADRWLQRSGKGMEEFGKNQANSPHLISVSYFPSSEQVFKGVAFGAVSIVFMDSERENNGSWLLTRYEKDGSISSGMVPLPGEEIISFDVKMNEILAKLKSSENFGTTLAQRGFAQKLFGLESSFVEENPEKVVKADEDFTNSPGEEWIRFYGNDKAGKAGRANWFWIQKSAIPFAKELLPKWKVSVSSMSLIGLDGRSANAMILPENSAYGRVSVGVGFFDTPEEARNFYRWLSSDLVKFVTASSGNNLSSYAKNVPDLSDFSNRNPIFKNDPSIEEINDRLLVLYGLTEEEDYIHNWVEENLATFSKNPFEGLTPEERKLFES